MGYSAKFRKLVSDKEKCRKLINGSSFSGRQIETWEKARRFIGGFINKDGKILDIGCANGFFLLCLREWSGRKLQLFGIDKKKEAIEEAKKISGRRTKNFIEKDVFGISRLPVHFPKRFEMVFWNVWENWEFKLPQEKKALREILRLVKPGGRCLMGFYDGQAKSARQIRAIRKLGVRLVRAVKNPTGIEILTWVDVL
jgi:SAM-dependent methyltransferase